MLIVGSGQISARKPGERFAVDEIGGARAGGRDVNPLLETPDAYGPADDRITILVQREGDGVVVLVGGEVDLSTGARLNQVLAAEIATCPALIVIDLDQVSFFTSVGLTALALAQRAARERDVEFRVVATGRAILRPLQITGMADDIVIYPTLSEALAGGRVDGGDPTRTSGF